MAGTKKFTADKFVVDGGSSSGFLKADGSVDSTSYGTGNSSFSGSYDDLSDKPTIPTDTNTQLSEAEITAMGFIQTQSDTQDLSISGQTLSLTSGGSVTLPDTNTQLSDGDIAAFGYIKTDNNTQRTNAEIDARIALNPEGFIDAIPSAGAGVGTYGNAGNAYKIDHITLDAQGRVTAVSTGATGTTTASSIETFTNKSGSNSQWTNDEGYITSFTDTNTQLSDGDIAAFGYIKTFTDTNTQLSDANIATMGYIKTFTDTNTQRTNADIDARIALNPEGFIDSYTDTNTQLSDAEIAALGYIKTYTDTNTQLSDAQITALGYIKSYTDTNTQLSDSDIAAFGYIKTDTNTQLSDSDIAALGYIKTFTDTNTQLSDGDIGAFGYIKTYTDTNTQRTNEEIRDIAAGQWIDGTNTTVVYDDTSNTIKINSVNTDTNTQLSDANIAAMGYIKTESDTQDLSISGQTLSLTNGGSVTLPDTNTQLSSAQITAMGFSTTDNNTQRSDEEIRDVAAAQWIDGTNTTVVVSDAGDTIKINSVNTNTNTQLSEAEITAMGFIQTQSDTQDLSISGHTISLTNGGSVTVPDNNTQRTNSEIDARIALNPEGFIDSYTDTNTQLSDANIAAMGYIKTYTDTNTQRAIHDTPVNGSTTTSISSNWAFDNVKTAVPSGALFTDTDTNTQLSDANIGAMGYIKTYTDTNTQRAIHDTPVNGSTTTSISSNWAFDNVKTAVPSGALFTDTNTNTQLSSAQITAMGFSTTDNNTFRAISSTPVNGATTTSISSDWAFDNVKTAVPVNALFTDTNTNTQLSEANITAMGFIQSQSDSQTLSISGTTLSLTSGGSVTLPDNNDNTQLSQAEIEAMGFSTTDNNTFRAISSTPVNGATTTSISSDWAFDNVKTAVPAGALFTDTNTNTQLSSAQITAMGFSTTDNNDNTQLSEAEITAMGFIQSYTDTNTQLSDANIGAMGYIKTYTDTNTQLSEANITAMGFIQTYTDTNTQLSDGDIAGFGYIKTDTNTQLGDADIAAFGYIKTDTNTQLSDANIAAFGYIKTDTNTQLSESQITAMGFTQTVGTVGGSGAANRIPKFAAGGSDVTNSTITDSGTQVSISTGSLLLNNVTFNQIKTSGNAQLVGTVNDTETLKIGTSTLGWKSITMYTPTFSFRSGADADFVDINPLVGDVSISGGFKVDGGTSSGFLKADGSIDTTTYSTGGGSFLPLAGGSLTGALHVDQSGGSYKLNVGATANGSIYTEGRIFSLGSIDTDSNITSNGKMTLGTNTVHTTDSVLSIEDLSSSISGIQFNANSAAYNRLWEVYNTSNAKRMGLVYDNANIRLHFVDRSEGELMTIMESGNIGINRTSPSYQLDVNGTFRASSSAYFAGTFGNLDTTSDTGINFELGTSALNTMRTDADAFRIYFGGTSANGESLKITQAGLMTLKTQGSTEFQWDLDGDFHADGDVIAYSTTVSDRRLKENITTIESATETVKQLRGVQYDWKAGSGTREGQTEIGLIAQEVEEVLPFLVREKTLMRGEEVKTVDYEKLVGLLIESNKELSSRIDELEKR